LKRKSRRHYGTSCRQPFEKRYRDKKDICYDDFDGKKMAKHQMKWIIEKGQDLLASEATHASTTILEDWWINEARTSEWELLACDADIAPSRCVEEVSIAFYKTDVANTTQSVYRVAELAVDLNDLSKDDMAMRISPSGRCYYRVKYEVCISMQSSLEFFVTVKGRKVGSLTVSYD
jgi:hypothetical protein